MHVHRIPGTYVHVHLALLSPAPTTSTQHVHTHTHTTYVLHITSFFFTSTARNRYHAHTHTPLHNGTPLIKNFSNHYWRMLEQFETHVHLREDLPKLIKGSYSTTIYTVSVPLVEETCNMSLSRHVWAASEVSTSTML